MGNKKENIDQLFSEKFKGLEVETPNDAWLNISGELDGIKRKKRAVFIRWSAIAASLLLAFSLGWYLNNTTTSTGIEQPFKQVVGEEELYPSPKKPSDLRKEAPRDIRSSNDIQAQTKSKKLSQQSSVVAVAKKSGSEDVKSSKTSKTKLGSNNSESWNEKLIIADRKRLNEAFHHILESSKEEQSFSLVNIDNYSPLITIDTNQTIQPQLNDLNPHLFPEKGSARYRSVEVALLGSPTLPFRNVRYSTENDALASNNIENERLENSYAGGIQVAYRSKGRMEYVAGVMVNNWSQTSNNILLQSSVQNNSSSGTNSNFEAVGNTSYGAVRFDVSQSVNQVVPAATNGQFALLPNIQQEYQYIEVPISMAYYLVDSKFQLKAQMGLNTRILSSSLVQLQYPTGESEDYNGLTPNSLSLQLSAGPSLAYSLSSRIKLQLMPTFLYGLTPNTNMDGVETYHHQFLIYSGFSFRL